MDDLIAATEQDSLPGTLPLFDVRKRELLLLPGGCVLLREWKLEWLKLLVTIEVALEVLKQHNLFIDSLRELEKVVLVYHLLVVSSGLRSTLTINVVEMEEVRVSDNLGRVIKENTVRAVAQLVAEAVLRREINELDHQLGLRLLGTLCREQLWSEDGGASCLDFGKLCRHLLFLLASLDVSVPWRRLKRLYSCLSIVLDSVWQRLDLLGR